MMLARQIKGEFAIANKGQLLTVSIMNRIKLNKPLSLIAHFTGQIGHGNRLDVNGPVRRSCHCCSIHVLPLSDIDGLNDRFRLGLGQVHMQ